MGESSLQVYFKARVAKAGGKAFKVNCESERGFPDLIVCTDWGLKLVEMKSKTGRLSIHQKRVHGELDGHAVSVSVLDSREAVDKWLLDYFYNPN